MHIAHCTFYNACSRSNTSPFFSEFRKQEVNPVFLLFPICILFLFELCFSRFIAQPRIETVFHLRVHPDTCSTLFSNAIRLFVQIFTDIHIHSTQHNKWPSLLTPRNKLADDYVIKQHLSLLTKQLKLDLRTYLLIELANAPFPAHLGWILGHIGTRTSPTR